MSILDRCSGAPISWGVCEVPGWGLQLDPERVLGEMAALGLVATEHGPDDFLPADDADAAATLARHGLRLVSGFVPTVLHRPDHDPVPGFRRALARFTTLGATSIIVAADAGTHGYDERATLDDAAWAQLLANLERLAHAAAAAGLAISLHPHVGTLVETKDDVERVLAGSSIPLCLDTGHLLIGGTDPLALAVAHAQRIGHVHLKDVDGDLAAAVRDGRLGYHDAVTRGLYVPLGQGAADIAALVGTLERAGYAGAYVLEQDTVLDGDDARPADDVRTSLDHLHRIDLDLDATPGAVASHGGGTP